MKEERIDGEDEEANGKKENIQSQNQAIAEEINEATGEKTGSSEVQSRFQEKSRRSSRSVQAADGQESRV
jgi:hypothetical protein